MEKEFFSFSIKYADELTKKNVAELTATMIQAMQSDDDFAKSVITKHSRNENLKKIKKIVKLFFNNLLLSIKTKHSVIIPLEQNHLFGQGYNYKLFNGVLQQFHKWGFIEITKGTIKKRTEIRATDCFRDDVINTIFKLAQADADGYYTATITDVKLCHSAKHGEYIRVAYAVANNHYYQNLFICHTTYGERFYRYWKANESRLKIGKRAKIKVNGTTVKAVKF